MIARRILALFFAAFVLVEARWHIEKREVTSICDPVSGNHSKILCYCINDFRQPDHIKSADCSLTVEGVKPTDHVWDTFAQLKTTSKITLTKSRDVFLQYIPTHALKHLENLVQLHVKYGNIEKVHRYAFSNLSNVEEISLIDSQIQIMEKHSFAHHKDLTTIKLDKNNIVEINRDVFIDLPSLENLYLTENQITTIHDKAFLHLSALKELEINMNKLFSLNNETFSGLRKLQKLDLSSNNLEVIGDNTFYPLKNLLSLNLEGNKIQMLDGRAFNGLAKLQYLTLAHNKLSTIVNDDVFLGLESLSTLSLRANEIKVLNTKAIAPLLKNFHGEESHLDVEDNLFPCDCKLDWFMQLMNRTHSKNLKIALENFKCFPDPDLRDRWNKVADAEKIELDDSQTGAEYEYYDESQLNGKLFYTDIRDLLSCEKDIDKGVKVTTQKITTLAILEKETKVTSSPTIASRKSVADKAVSVHRDAIPTSEDTFMPFISSSVKPVGIKPQVNHGVLDLSVDETSPKPKDIIENEINHEHKPNSYTTTRLVNVSAKPVNVYDNMASDEAKPDKLKSQRSLQAEFQDMPSIGHNNVGCVALISLICFRLFH